MLWKWNFLPHNFLAFDVVLVFEHRHTLIHRHAFQSRIIEDENGEMFAS